MTTTTTREQWLNELTEYLAPRFNDHEMRIPAKCQLSCGWPSKRAMGAKNRRIGECWAPVCAGDGTTHIFISPYLSDPVEVGATVAHELVHAAIGVEHGHKAPFRRAAGTIGLEGKMTATHAGEELKTFLEFAIDELGPYPHGGLDGMQTTVKKQNTRLLKAECPICGYVIRVTKTWVEEAGLPICPLDECSFELA